MSSTLKRLFVTIHVGVLNLDITRGEDALREQLDELQNLAYKKVDERHRKLSKFLSRDANDPDIEFEQYELTENDQFAEIVLGNVGTVAMAIYSGGEIPKDAIEEFRDAFVQACKESAQAHGIDPEMVKYFRATANRYYEYSELSELPL